MKKIVSLLLVLTMAAALFTGCSSGNNKEKVTLTVLSLQDYWDRDVFDQFEEETGIKVIVEEADTPEAMQTKFQSGAIDYDLFCTSDYMIETWIEEGRLLELDYDNITNAENIDERYWGFSEAFDPGNLYSIPHFWGTVGILYNTSMVDEEVTSWSVLWDEKYSGNIIMQNSMRDCFIAPMKLLGYSLNSDNQAEWEEAKGMLIDQKPLVQSYLVDEARSQMQGSNAAMAVVYSGEAFLAREENPDLEYVVPEEGSNIWVDSWCIPDTCTNKEAAEQFLDFLCREDIAMKNFEYTYYATPNKAVYEALDAEFTEDEGIFPTDEVIKNCETMTSFSEEMVTYIGELWKEVKGK